MPLWLDNLFKTVRKSVQPNQLNPLGDRGENVAARFLLNLGYKIIIRNFRCDGGEIDIVARDGKTLVFVEVKTRAYDDPTPEEQVNLVKQNQLTKAGKFYLSRYGVPQPPARFDVIAIVWPKNSNPQIRHMIAAFEATF
jgi:putative endonuclease